MRKVVNRITQPFSRAKRKFAQKIRDKAISRAETRIVLAGKKPDDFNALDLEIIVKEEEDKLKQELREKGLLAAAVILGVGWFH